MIFINQWSIILQQRITIIFQKKYCSVVETFISKFHIKYYENKNEFTAKVSRWLPPKGVSQISRRVENKLNMRMHIYFITYLPLI
jgi:hypothetical protein